MRARRHATERKLLAFRYGRNIRCTCAGIAISCSASPFFCYRFPLSALAGTSGLVGHVDRNVDVLMRRWSDVGIISLHIEPGWATFGNSGGGTA